ncbi:MAG: hypothetical protein WCZ90_03795 [Melioribacteraceae bacterium]
MSSFSCPHITGNSFCARLNVDCVPGRKGCVLSNKVSFAIPADKRKLPGEENKTNDPFKNYRRKKK